MSDESGISRRDFLKAVPWLVAGGVAALKAKNEVSVITSGIFENEGIQYQPIYEQHIQGPEIPLNPQANGLFIETNVDHTVVKGHTDGTFDTKKYTHYDMDIDSLIESLSNAPGRKEMIDKATKMRIPVAFGDVATNDIQEITEMIRFTTDDDKKKFYGGLLLAASSFFPEGLRRAIEKRAKNPMTRRQFLIKSGAALATVLGTAYGGWLSTDTSFFDDLTQGKVALAKQTDPYNRLLIRLHGFAKDLHPFPPAIFTRNLVMALKIKQLGKYLKSTGINNPLTAFDVGGAHSGIEDFICLPEELLRQMIVMINRDYVNRSFAKYGDFFSTTRVAQADSTGVYHDLVLLKDEKLINMLNSG